MKREELTAKSFANFMGLDPSNSSCKYFLQDHYATIEAALTALQSESGRVSVPRDDGLASALHLSLSEPRDGMLFGADDVAVSRALVEKIYAMLSAAPAPAATKGTGEGWREQLEAKLKAASKGQPETWGFVAMFMDMIAEVAEADPSPAAPVCDDASERHDG